MHDSDLRTNIENVWIDDTMNECTHCTQIGCSRKMTHYLLPWRLDWYPARWLIDLRTMIEVHSMYPRKWALCSVIVSIAKGLQKKIYVVEIARNSIGNRHKYSGHEPRLSIMWKEIIFLQSQIRAVQFIIFITIFEKSYSNMFFLESMITKQMQFVRIFLCMWEPWARYNDSDGDCRKSNCPAEWLSFAILYSCHSCAANDTMKRILTADTRKVRLSSNNLAQNRICSFNSAWRVTVCIGVNNCETFFRLSVFDVFFYEISSFFPLPQTKCLRSFIDFNAYRIVALWICLSASMKWK